MFRTPPRPHVTAGEADDECRGKTEDQIRHSQSGNAVAIGKPTLYAVAARPLGSALFRLKLNLESSGFAGLCCPCDRLAG